MQHKNTVVLDRVHFGHYRQLEPSPGGWEARPTILCFVAHYLPGYRSGGPVRTIANFVDHLGDQFDIRIVTRDRDALDMKPYDGVTVDGWNTVGKAQVFYASNRTMTLGGIARLLRETPHDVLYLNSFFAFGFSGLPLIARRLGIAPKVSCVIAPRGEFSAGAIALKALKKRSYMMITNALGLYSNLQWQASSPFEVDDIQRELGDLAARIHIAPNLPAKIHVTHVDNVVVTTRKAGPLRIVFLSRISPKKNLDFLLKILGQVKCQVELMIYGPLREPDYWSRCQALISRLPGNVSAEYRGEVMPAAVLETFSASDLFVLPTHGENYGHVVLESLVAGTPALIIDRTPWQAYKDNAVEVLRLEEPVAWVQAIERWAGSDDQHFIRMRTAARAYAQRYLDTSGALEQNCCLFREALASSQKGYERFK